MTDKVWTAADLEMGVLRLNHKDQNLTLLQGYSYKDANGDVLEDLPKKSISLSVEFNMLPQDMRDSLIMLFNYVYQKALIKEGMN